jgi:hypothetical protein
MIDSDKIKNNMERRIENLDNFILESKETDNRRSEYSKIPELDKMAERYGLVEILYGLMNFYNDGIEKSTGKLVEDFLKKIEKITK